MVPNRLAHLGVHRAPIWHNYTVLAIAQQTSVAGSDTPYYNNSIRIVGVSH